MPSRARIILDANREYVGTIWIKNGFVDWCASNDALQEFEGLPYSVFLKAIRSMGWTATRPRSINWVFR